MNLALRLATVVAGETEFGRIVSATLDETIAQLDAQLVHLCVVAPDGAGLELAGQRGVPPALLPRLARFGLGDGFLAARAAATREIQLVSGADALPPAMDLARELLARARCRCIVALPLLASSQLVGVLVYASRASPPPAPDELDALRIVANVLAAGVAKAQALERERRAEEALRQHEEQLRDVIENASDGIFLADLTGRYTDANAAGCRMFRCAREELVGRSITDFLLPRDVPRFLAARERALAGRTELEEWTVVRKDGTTFVAEISSKLLPCGLWQGLVRDVTDRRLAQDALRENEQLFRLMVDNAPIGMTLIALDGRFLRVNSALCDMVGYTAEELLQRRFQDVTHPDDLALDVDLLARLVRGDLARYELPKRYVRKDGSLLQVVVHASVARDARGRALYGVAQVVDVTEQQRARAEREELLARIDAERGWLRAVFDRSPVGIVLFKSAAGQRLFANRQAQQLLGGPITEDTTLEQIAARLRTPAGAPVAPEQLPSRRALRGQPVTHEEFLLVPPREGGAVIPIAVSAATIQDPAGRVIGAVVLIEDLRMAKALERLREEWVSVIAHDLRQPVTSIAMYADRVARLRRDDRETCASLEHVTASARRLHHMISDLQDLSRLEAHRLELHPRPTDLASLARAVVDRMASETRGRLVLVQARGELAPALVDAHRFEQVLGNLVSNAVKYGAAETDVVVALERVGDDVRVSVTNHGAGIAGEDLPLVFERFERSRSARRSGVAGLGLGLYITKGLVEAQGGRIWAASTPGETTTFVFTVPTAGARPDAR